MAADSSCAIVGNRAALVIPPNLMPACFCNSLLPLKTSSKVYLTKFFDTLAISAANPAKSATGEYLNSFTNLGNRL